MIGSFDIGKNKEEKKGAKNSFFYRSPYTKSVLKGKSFSLLYNDLARWLFITLAFTGILSTGWFGIPLAPRYFLHNEVDILASLFTVFSALGTIWGVMAYREFTKSANLVQHTRDLAKKLDPMIGNYLYLSYNPETRDYESGYLPLGPIDFWDKETQVPNWLDKGKYWHILLGLQIPNKEVILQVVRDQDLPFSYGRRNVAVTFRELMPEQTEPIGSVSSEAGATTKTRAAAIKKEQEQDQQQQQQQNRKLYRYRVKIPQWIVMNTDYPRLLVSQKEEEKEREKKEPEEEKLNIEYNDENIELSTLIIQLNEKLVYTADEIIEREKPRIRFQWRISGLGIYLNKSLPLRIIYNEVLSRFPGAKKRTIDYTNENLANIKDDDLIDSIIEIAVDKGGIPDKIIDKFRILVSFLKSEYAKHGLGEGSSKYHNFHHSLEVTYLAVQMLPKELRGQKFTWKDYEYLLLAGVLHDYDPSQQPPMGFEKTTTDSSNNIDSRNNSAQQQPKGPKVSRTIDEINKTRILDAYFTMNRSEFENYFRAYKSALLPPIELTTTHPEYVKVNWKLTESLIVETLIWRSDFPFFKQRLAQEMFNQHLDRIEKNGYNRNKIKLLGEVLWLADLSVTYMGSDPIRAWDRVSKLYDELYLPRFEAVTRTDAFFSDFADNDLFEELMHMRHFPDILRRRWNLIYQFFHEGNPSTQLNRTINNARRLYLKVNLDIGMRDCEMLQTIASSNWSEYFIGIAKDQNEVLKAKSRLANLDPQNASSFWGDIMKLVPNIQDKSIDNFFMVLPEASAFLSNMEQKLLLRSLLSTLKMKLVNNRGTVQILTDIEEYSATFKELLAIVSDVSFQLTNSHKRAYFPEGWSDKAFIQGRHLKVLILSPAS